VAQTHDGAMKTAAKCAGILVEDFLARQANGQKWCVLDRVWHPFADFGTDAFRYDGLFSSCRAARVAQRAAVPKRPRAQPERGRSYVAARDGDKFQARGRVNHLVRMELIPDPDDLPCADCGHGGDGRRHEYDHHLGYAAENHERVEAVCTLCHAARERSRGAFGGFGSQRGA
jgi:hypothetical protein